MSVEFLPDLSVASAGLDRDMRAKFADSLSYLHSQGLCPQDRTDGEFTAALDEIRSHRIRPGVYGRYYDLVFAARERRFDAVGALFREIVDLAAERPVWAAAPFMAEALGADFCRYHRVIANRLPPDIRSAAPPPDRWEAFAANLAASRALIAAADPALAAEVSDLTVEIVGVDAPRSAQCGGFGGASSLMLWGGVLLNIRRYATALELFEGLIHETAHHLLFGLALDEPLVLNHVDERFISPLRSDPRPLDGIFHQIFVCARLHHAYGRLLAAEILPAADRARAEQRIAAFRGQFFAGYETVARQGRLTRNGERILSSMHAYMQPAPTRALT